MYIYTYVCIYIHTQQERNHETFSCFQLLTHLPFRQGMFRLRHLTEPPQQHKTGSSGYERQRVDDSMNRSDEDGGCIGAGRNTGSTNDNKGQTS